MRFDQNIFRTIFFITICLFGEISLANEKITFNSDSVAQ